MTGQWQKHETLDNEALAIFEAAYPKNLGVTYRPIAPYYTQIVAGKNYIFTVEATVTSPAAKPGIKYLQTFQALTEDGGTISKGTILNQLPLHVDPALDFFLDQRFPIGGWHLHTELTDDALEVFNAVKPQQLGYNYTPIAPYFTQVVNGTNYIFAAIGAPVVPNAKEQLVFIKTHQSTDGKIESGIIIGHQPIENVA